MHFSLAVLVALGSVAPGIAYTPESTVESDAIAERGLAQQYAALQDGSLARALQAQDIPPPCDRSNVVVRREYSNFSNQEKLQYSKAVKCIMDSPSKTPAGLAPGAKSRYDDFVAQHMNQTGYIHLSGSFLSWHRYFLWSFETALRDECGYTGSMPYWNWAKSAKDPLNSPYFDGSEYSQGGNGVDKLHNCTRPGSVDAACIWPTVETRGGGCVETGPYVGYQANLSSVNCWFDYPNVVGGEFLSYQPRCMRRDILPEYTQALGTEDHLLALFTNSSLDLVGPWQDALQAGTGLHSVGHFTYGGDPGGDVYTSPNDPMFWLHHGMIDRVWWMWQNQKPIERLFQIDGTRTQANEPPSANATIEDILDLSYVEPESYPASAIKYHVSTLGGPYCYVYE